MGTGNFLWNLSKKYFTVGLIGLTVSDRYFSIVHVQGTSMPSTFNSHINNSKEPLADDCVLVEKLCLEKYKFSCGDVVVFCSPTNHREKHIKRITGLPGDWISTPHKYDVVVVPEGHCWVEGDNSEFSLDSRSFGPRIRTIFTDNARKSREVTLSATPGFNFCGGQARLDFSCSIGVLAVKQHCVRTGRKIHIPLGLVRGRVTHIVWPPNRVGKVDSTIPQGRLPF